MRIDNLVPLLLTIGANNFNMEEIRNKLDHLPLKISGVSVKSG